MPATGTVTVVMNSTDLGWAAETTDGEREVEFIVVRDDQGKPQLREVGKLEPGDEVATEVRALTGSSLSPGKVRKKVLEVRCTVETWSKPGILLTEKKYDALFWTESAVKKFLFPYYHSQRLWSKELADLEAEFDSDPDAVAIAHLAPSKARRVEEGVNSLAVLTPAAAPAFPDYVIVAAEYLRRRKRG